MTLLNLDTVPGRRAFKLDQVVVRTVGGEEGAGVLEVLALRLALESALLDALKNQFARRMRRSDAVSVLGIQ